jgi:YegS/Rv2252/BmrU family lipid kinase
LLYLDYAILTKTLIKLKEQSIKEWYIIVNPHAGSKKTQRDWPHIIQLLDGEGIVFQSVFTEFQYHATELARKAIVNMGYRKLIVVGGDGTLNEVLNGIITQDTVATTDIMLGVISVGTGNDWGRMYNMPSTYIDQIRVIKKEKTFLHDIGKVSYMHNEDKKIHHFINIAGMGFDALVAKKSNIAKQRGASGVITYLISLLTSLFQYGHSYIEIEKANQKIFSGKVFSMSIGICRYNGGGMMQLPNAIPDDGLFDVTVIRKVSKLKVIMNLSRLYDGSFIMMKEVDTFTGSDFKITSIPENNVFLETDGESLGNSPLIFHVLPRAIKMLIS